MKPKTYRVYFCITLPQPPYNNNYNYKEKIKLRSLLKNRKKLKADKTSSTLSIIQKNTGVRDRFVAEMKCINKNPDDSKLKIKDIESVLVQNGCPRYVERGKT